MSNLPITFENKVNSPELLAFLAQYGETKYLSAEEINQMKEGLNELYNSILGSGITSILTPQFVDQDIVFPQFFSWKFLGTETILDANVSIPVPFAVTGKHRQDLIIAENGILIRIPGLEVDLATPVYEPLYNNTTQLRITSFEVNESGYGEPSNIIVGTDYVKKSFSQSRYYLDLSGANVSIPIPANGAWGMILTNPLLTSIACLDLSAIVGNPSAEVPQLGKLFKITNETGNPLELKHLTGVGIQFITKNALSIIVPNKESVFVEYDGTSAKELFRSWSSGTEPSYTVIASNVVDSSPVTGTTAITTVETFVIPANTFKTGDIILFRCRIIKMGSAGAVAHRHSIGGFPVFFYPSAIFSQLERTLVVKSATVTQDISGGYSAATSNGGYGEATNLNINWTLPQNLLIKLNNQNVADSSVVSFWELSRIRKN